MTKLDAPQIAAVAARAGFSGDALRMAVAVALCESSGNTDAHGDRDNPRPGCGSYGLWQINSCPHRDKASPTRYGTDPSPLYDPDTNARSAYAISSGGVNWGPWSTKAKAARLAPTLDLGAGAGAGTAPVKAGPIPLPTMPKIVSESAVQAWARRAAYWGVGVGLVGLGIALIVSDLAPQAVTQLTGE